MSLHRVGYLPYHFAAGGVREGIGSLLQRRQGVVPLKQREGNTKNEIYERADQSSQCTGRSSITAINRKYRRALDQQMRRERASYDSPSATTEVAHGKYRNYRAQAEHQPSDSGRLKLCGFFSHWSEVRTQESTVRSQHSGYRSVCGLSYGAGTTAFCLLTPVYSRPLQR